MLMGTMLRKISMVRDSAATEVAALMIAAVSAVDLIMGFTSTEMMRMSRQIKSVVINKMRVVSTDMLTRTMSAISRASPSDMVPNLAVLTSAGGLKHFSGTGHSCCQSCATSRRSAGAAVG